MDRRLDPRSIVTPYAFAVHPDLLGRPLATPVQRLGAILVDLIVIFLLAQIGLTPLALASVALLIWLALRKPGRDALGKIFRVALGCLAFVILAVLVLVVLWLRYGDDLRSVVDEAESGVPIVSVEGSSPGETGPAESPGAFFQVLQGIRGAAALQDAGDADEARALMGEIAARALESGLTRAQVRELLVGLTPNDATWVDEAPSLIDGVMEGLSIAGSGSQGAAVPTEGETPVGDPGTAFGSAARDSIDQLNRTIRISEEEKADLQQALARTESLLEEEREGGALDWLLNLIDDLGIGFGWGALYLTITHAWWKGTSIGKKLFRIRVVMIDKRPLNWWLSFERAGGYAAGFATGLLGFAQVFWDPNRQAIHDKVSETVVIQDGKDPLPGPWMEEGKQQWDRRNRAPSRTGGP